MNWRPNKVSLLHQVASDIAVYVVPVVKMLNEVSLHPKMGKKNLKSVPNRSVCDKHEVNKGNNNWNN